MNVFHLGHVIAERILFWENDEASMVLIRIGQLRAIDSEQEGTLYLCPYQIENLGCFELPIEFRSGMDAIDALQNAFVAIGATLREAQSQTGRRLCWGDRDNPTIGFPEECIDSDILIENTSE
ncbi:MAG: hypothetical protein K8F91_05315 [Candidatus Obscuribacterales bacterium]|nr:hypothetical protein [Candidatus Obscuribacterales bacterium]